MTACIAAGAFLFWPTIRRLTDPGYEDPNQVLRAAKDAIVRQLKDPESARFGEVRVYATYEGAGMIACGTVNAKNAFGGYVGFKRFYSQDGNSISTDVDDDSKVFEDGWKLCAGRVLASSKTEIAGQ